MTLRIHIVQKGDTLWDIAKKYGVDFEELKSMNTQISSPDMIMPGMKIKVPGTAKHVKKETQKKEQVKTPYKEVPIHPQPVIQPDDHKKKKEVQIESPSLQMPKPPAPELPPIQQVPETPVIPQMPLQPIMQMPIMEQEMKNYTTINFPEIPIHHHPKEEKVEKKPVKKKEKPKKEQKPVAQPAPAPVPMPYTPMPMLPQMPFCCLMMHPCQHQWSVPVPMPCEAPMPLMDPMHFAPFHKWQGQPMPVPMQGGGDCGCGEANVGVVNHPTSLPHSHSHSHGSLMQQPPEQSQMHTYPPQSQFQTNFYPTPPGFSPYRKDDEEEKNENE